MNGPAPLFHLKLSKISFFISSALGMFFIKITHAELVCHDPFVYFQNNCYYFSTEEQHFPIAEEICNNYSSPTNPCHLTSIHSKGEYDFIDMWAFYLWEYLPYWLGATKNLTTGSFDSWIDGSAMDFFDYFKPNRSVGECLRQFDEFEWDAYFCSANETMNYVCKKKAEDISSDVSLVCHEPFTLFHSNCYYFASHKKTFRQAEAVCNSFSDSSSCHLVSIHSDDENFFIYDQASSLWGSVKYWLGARFIDGEIPRSWLDGTPTNFMYYKSSKGEGSCMQQWEPFGWDDCSCLRYKKFVCKKAAEYFANEGTLRLVGTPVSVEGQLQIFRRGVWGGVRHRNFLTVVCNQLGYPGGNNSSDLVKFDVYPSVHVMLDIIACDGSELSVLDCEHQWYQESYPDTNVSDVYAMCNRPAEFTPRLYNGTSVYEGRLEVWEGNQWRRVCSSTIDSDEAEVVCRYLGYQSLEAFYNWPKFGNGISPVSSWSFSCDPTATSLKKCYPSYLFLRKLDCDSVAVRCKKREEAALKHYDTNLRALLGVASTLLGLATLSGLIIYMIKGRRRRRNETIADTQGNGMSPDLPANNVGQSLDPPE